MYDMHINGDDNQGAAVTTSTPVAVLAEQRAPRGSWPDSRLAILRGRVDRSEATARRYWLRFLDAPFAKEFRDAGALDFDEFADAVPRILRCDEGQIDRETIQEWWEFAARRRWLEPVGPRWGLSERAEKDLRVEYERVNSPDPKRLAGHVSRWVIPGGLAGFAGLFGAKNLSIELTIMAIAVVIVVGLLLSEVLSRATDPSMDRFLARRAWEWLEGRRVWPGRGTNCADVEFSRLYIDTPWSTTTTNS